MKSICVCRRKAIAQGLAFISGAGLLPGFAGAAEPKWVCADPDGSDRSFRDSAHFTENSPDPQQVCRLCGFFEADPSPPCGHCRIFNGPTNTNGHCDSWAAKS